MDTLTRFSTSHNTPASTVHRTHQYNESQCILIPPEKEPAFPPLEIYWVCIGNVLNANKYLGLICFQYIQNILPMGGNVFFHFICCTPDLYIPREYRLHSTVKPR